MILHGKNDTSKSEVRNTTLDVSVKNIGNGKCIGCSCNNQSAKVNDVSDIGIMLNDLLSKRKEMKTTIKLELAFE